MAAALYTLCTLAACGCAWLLRRGYQRSRSALLLWSCLCFVGLTLSNLLRLIDLVFLPHVDLFLWRNLVTLLSMLLLLWGLIWGARR